MAAGAPRPPLGSEAIGGEAFCPFSRDFGGFPLVPAVAGVLGAIAPGVASAPRVAAIVVVRRAMAVAGPLVFIVPGVCAIGVFARAVAACVIERRGPGSIGRGAEPTGNRRWSAIGALFVLGLAARLLAIVPATAAAIVAAAAPGFVALVAPRRACGCVDRRDRLRAGPRAAARDRGRDRADRSGRSVPPRA